MSKIFDELSKDSEYEREQKILEKWKSEDILDKTIQNAVDGSCAPGVFPLVSFPNLIGCIGAAVIVIAAIATPIAKSQQAREVWFYVMSGGALLKITVMEIARIVG